MDVSHGLAVPTELPMLEALSWFDREWRKLSPLEMLRRHEAGWRNLRVVADPSAKELEFIRALIRRYESVLDV